jgi:eukaryotic-like serine/threonine-protein kinase
VSQGPPTVEVPASSSLRGLTQQAADEVLRAEGVELVPEFVPTPSAEVAKDLVIGVADGTPAELPQGSTVQVLISSGPPGPAITDVTGWWFEEAEAALAGLGFEVDYRGEVNLTIETGRVLRTEPAAGQPAAVGSTIVVVVAENGSSVKVPDLRGRRVARAQQLLQQRGLAVGTVNCSGDGQVLMTTPLPGSYVAPQTPVDIWCF